MRQFASSVCVFSYKDRNYTNPSVIFNPILFSIFFFLLIEHNFNSSRHVCFRFVSYILFFHPKSMFLIFLLTFLPSFTPSFSPSFLPLLLPSLSPSFLSSLLPSFSPSFLHSFLPSHLRSFLFAFLPSHVHSFLCNFMKRSSVMRIHSRNPRAVTLQVEPVHTLWECRAGRELI